MRPARLCLEMAAPTWLGRAPLHAAAISLYVLPACKGKNVIAEPRCGSAPASARTMPTTVPAERGRRQNAGLVFRNRPLLRTLEPAAAMADAGRRLRPRGRPARLSRHGRAQPVRRGTGV